MVVPNRSPRARKVPAPRAGREPPRTRRAQTSPKTRVPPTHPVNRRAAKTARARTRRTGPTRRAARLPTTSARLARPNLRQIRKHRDPQRGEINRPRVTRPTRGRATIRRATRPIGGAAALRVKIPPRKARNKAGASRTTHKELRGRTSRGRPGLTNRPMVRRNPGRKREARVLATTSQPARIPLSPVPPRKEMAVRRLRGGRTPRMRRTVRHRAAMAPRPASRPVKPTSPRAARTPRPASRGRIRLRNPMPRPTARNLMASPTAPPRKAARNVTRTRLRSDRERSRLAVPPTPK